MNGYCARIIVICIVATIAISAPAAAEWQPNGNNLVSWYGAYPKLCSDGQGGAIVVYADATRGWSLYALRIDGYGNLLWDEGGVPLIWPVAETNNHRVIADGAGGAIVAWQDRRSGTYDVYTQRVDASGAVLWDPAGVPVCTASTDQSQIAMVSDERGGAVIVWTDERNGNKDLYFTRIDSGGNCVWGPTGGQQLTNDVLDQSYPAAVADGTGGMIVAWQDERSGGFSDIYAVKINGDGSWQWGGMNGIPVCTAASYQQNPVIVSDDAGGAVISWMDTRTPQGVYAQRMSYVGNPKWAADGILVGSTGDVCYPQCAVSDGAGSIYIGWMSMSYTTYVYSLYAQKVSRAGALEWQAPGFAFSSGEGDQTAPQFVSLGTAGIIASWNESRFGTHDIYAQRVSAAGAAQWTENGVALCNAFSNQHWPAIATDGAGGAIVAWNDYRNGLYQMPYAQRVTAEGYWGYPAPDIAGVRDIPGDQGGNVNLAWDASRLDPAPEHLIDHYTIWRAITPEAAAPLLANGARLMADARLGPGARVLRAAEINGEPYYWDLVLTAGAYYLETYSKAVPTLFDSTETSAERQYFQVIAHTDDPYVFFVSEPDSGRSVDNLAPAPPVGLAGEQQYTPEGIELTWRPNAEGDLTAYAIHRGTSAEFVPGPGNLVASIPDTLYLDGEWSWDGGYYYKVAAIDIHGNVSGYALLAPDGVTGVETPKAQAASYLAQNFPNPFNPATRIAFGLAAPANVSLRIYDASGRLVRMLVNGQRPAGAYAETWDGRDARGAAVASGIYFYRLEAGAFSQTRKMILLK